MTATNPAALAGLELADVVSNGQASEGDSAEWITAALEAVLKLRAPGLYASTPVVVQLAARVGRELELGRQSQQLLERSIRVRDIGMIALPDTVVLNTRTLAPSDWQLLNRHPILGAELLAGLGPAAIVAPIIRSHHERWDGEGYPDGHRGENIPVLSRVIAICDAFVAMASDRPYRRGIGTELALEQIRLERGTQFDPQITDTFLALLAGIRRGTDVPHAAGAGLVTGSGVRPVRGQAPRVDLAGALADFDVVPVFAPAYDQLQAAIGDARSTVGAIIAATEGDTGLTIAVLRKAQAVAGRRGIASVSAAVEALSREQIQATISELPQVDFPWRTTPLELLLHRSRIHAQAVARAASRIARELGLPESDDLLTAALLHDIGKLVLSRLGAEYSGAASTATPEDRVLEERRALGVDHASLGGTILRRWGLPGSLAGAVENHHTSDAGDETATYVRLADMLAHHAQGEVIDRSIMLSTAHACALSTKALRDVMFDLPHSGGSRRHRAEPSPLSSRETEVLARLAEGKVYKIIAVELGLAASTIRSHLQHIYVKLGVVDRAQAVLRATEMGWI
jgi:putative nucleotidyltransferase with HDIG domain